MLVLRGADADADAGALVRMLMRVRVGAGAGADALCLAFESSPGARDSAARVTAEGAGRPIGYGR